MWQKEATLGLIKSSQNLRIQILFTAGIVNQVRNCIADARNTIEKVVITYTKPVLVNNSIFGV